MTKSSLLRAALCASALVSALDGAHAQFYWPWETPPRPAPQIIIQRPQRHYAPPAAVQAPRRHVRPGAHKVDHSPRPQKPAEAKPAEPKPTEEAAQPPPEGPPPPYEPQMLRLSELLGALAFLQPLCGGEPEAQWRERMNAMINAEQPTPQRRERLAGAYNKGFREYAATYRRCTPAAEVIISRSLNEGGRLTRDLTNRFGG